MRHRPAVWLLAGTLGVASCGDREPPPPPAAAAAPAPADSVTAAPDTLQGDSVMARDTARTPQ